MANNRGLQGMKKKIEVAQSKLTEARRALFPSVQAAAEWNDGLASTQPSDPTHGRYYIGKNQKLSVSQPLFYGGELHYTIKQAEESLKSSKADYEKQKGEFLLQIESAYYGLLKAEYNVQYQFDLYNRTNTLRKRVSEERSQKLISEIDYLNFDSKYQETYFQIESSKNDYESAVLVLHQAMFLDPQLPTPVDLRLHFTKTQANYDELLKIALQNNPDLRMKEFGVVAAEYGLKVFKAKKLPRLDLKASYGRLGEIFRDTDALVGDNADLDTEREWFVGFQGSMPVGPNSVSYSRTKNVFGPTVLALTGSESQRHHVEFNLFDKLADITDEKAAEATYLEALADLDKARNDVALKLRDDFYNMQKSLIQIDSSISKLRYQGKQNQIQEYLLGLQETNAATYVEGLQEEAQNKFSFIQAVADYNLALTDIGLTIGDPYYLARKPKA
ncbi:MAG: TolC family protein [Micavibrio sp.]|nr:TolC family protein [Micavibrio sp.]